MTVSRLLLTAALLLAPLPAMAAPFTYEPETCEFRITFPEKPLIEQKCTGTEKKICSEIVTYTKVISAESSVNFRITCDPQDPKQLERYTPAIMQETVKQLLSDASLEGDPPRAYAKNGYKVAATVSTGLRGDREIIYTGQIWIGLKSLFTLEGDMTGPQDAKADKLFTEILSSMHAKNKLPKDAVDAAAKAMATGKDEDPMLTQPEDKYAP